jgi:hypothetical protein
VNVVRRTDLQRLALAWQGPCVSVFLPTHRAGREVEQAPIRLKNLLRQATDVLNSDGVRTPEIDRLLAPLRRLLDDRLFWQYQSDGLALFSRPGWWRFFRVPLDLPELAVVADRFHVSPLLPLLTGDGHSSASLVRAQHSTTASPPHPPSSSARSRASVAASSATSSSARSPSCSEKGFTRSPH